MNETPAPTPARSKQLLPLALGLVTALLLLAIVYIVLMIRAQAPPSADNSAAAADSAQSKAPAMIEQSAADVGQDGVFDQPPAGGEVKAQPNAEVGSLVRCPVSELYFYVKEDQDVVVVDGDLWYVCCAVCFESMKDDPKSYIEAL